MILICGIPTETPVALLIQQLENNKLPYLLFNQRDFISTNMVYKIVNGKIQGTIRLNDSTVDLNKITGVYNRLINFMSIPEYEDTKDEAVRHHCAKLHDTINQWLEVTDAKVVNKNSSMISNMSKPFQTQLISDFDLDIPETIITNQPEEVVSFLKEKERVIYKSASGVRSIVQELTEEDIPKLKKICWCPTQFQEYVEGNNIRVHVLGDQVFSTLIKSSATDYRYDSDTEYIPVNLPDTINRACIALTKSLDMCFSGVDLKYDESKDRYTCFEVNPSPAYSHYEKHSGQKISHALANYLLGNVA
ncbi:hypothetical protein U6A24_13475 [Aquimarina gracilis]|uniref:ATP-grasp domain-containing protein n=1 Tax=Aquimarina gracilis TaxID=874422 RepID=A0ABU5ZX89_9FLAO|nr:hypothetical protein [Aquimarina gracilis]MEB3346482.1 hypothetical protein [Aquimarina gracilis]